MVWLLCCVQCRSKRVRRPDKMPTTLCSLEDLSLDTLTANVGALPDTAAMEVDKEKESSPLPPQLGNKLLSKMKQTKRLNDKTMKLFRRKVIRLTKADFSHTQVTLSGLEMLSEHSMQELHLYGMKELDLDRLVSNCLTAACRQQSLQLLNIGGTTPPTPSSTFVPPPPPFAALNKLRCLQVLTVSETRFDDQALENVCKQLKIKHLDISRTLVTCLEPIEMLRPQLATLILHRISLAKKSTLRSPIDIILSLTKLEILDLSDAPSSTEDGAQSNWNGTLGEELLNCLVKAELAGRDTFLNGLRVLDISGQQMTVSGCTVGNLLKHRKKLEFLGLLLTNTCFLPEIMELDCVQVAGDATRSQVLCALRTYSRPQREAFSARSLYAAFNELANNYQLFQNDQAKQYLYCINRTMCSDRSNLSVQMAGTACLYHLCKNERARSLTALEIHSLVDRCLDAAESHPKLIQLHKNIWLTLCNDHILQSSCFDLCRCCSVALESMTNNPDQAVSRLTVAIVSILVAKIPTTKTGALGTNQRYMRFLLDLVVQKVEEHTANEQNNQPMGDVTLKFTLSALWNLTDESPKTCELFMKEGGLYSVLQVLNKFEGNASVQTKVLGLLNNVAEVPALQGRMVEKWCLETMLKLLESDRIEVSYFAAGILSNLCLYGPWEKQPSCAQCSEKLCDTINGWGVPETEMVAYRSFRPFFPLLLRDDLPGAQLWALWAIRHVCSKNPQRYLDMFRRQEGLKAVTRLVEAPTANEHRLTTPSPASRKVAQEIVDLFQ